MRQFAKSHTVWEAAVDAVAELDAMMSLACVADMGSVYGPMCRPRLMEAHSKQQVRKNTVSMGLASVSKGHIVDCCGDANDEN